MALAPPCIFGRRHARPRPPLGQRGDQRAATRICFEWRVKQVRRFRETTRSDTRSEIAHSAPFEKKKKIQ